MACVKMSAVLQARLIRMLIDGPCTIQDLADETGLHPVTCQEYCRELRRAGAAHICAWEKDSRNRDSIKVYKLGPGKEAKREKLTPAQRQARVRAKKAAAALLLVTGGAAQFTATANGRMRLEMPA